MSLTRRTGACLVSTPPLSRTIFEEAAYGCSLSRALSRTSRAESRARVSSRLRLLCHRRECRVKSELNASKQWYSDWGSLYAPNEPHNYAERIKRLREQSDRNPGVRLQTNNADYGQGKPFKEFAITKKEKKPEVM